MSPTGLLRKASSRCHIGQSCGERAERRGALTKLVPRTAIRSARNLPASVDHISRGLALRQQARVLNETSTAALGGPIRWFKWVRKRQSHGFSACRLGVSCVCPAISQCQTGRIGEQAACLTGRVLEGLTVSSEVPGRSPTPSSPWTRVHVLPRLPHV